MVRWLSEVCGVPVARIRARVYTHKMYEEKECELSIALPAKDRRRLGLVGGGLADLTSIA